MNKKLENKVSCLKGKCISMTILELSCSRRELVNVNEKL